MSIIGVTKHNENIWNVLQKPKINYLKSPRHVSKFHDQVKNIEKKNEHSTMGYAHYPLPKPNEYLRKKSGKRLKRSPMKCETHNAHSNREEWDKPWDSKASKQTLKNDKEKNFIVENKKSIKNIKPKREQIRYVDTVKGDAHALLPSGLELRFIYRKNFGKIPNYVLESRKIQQNDTEDDESNSTEQYRYITKEEREQILNGLKTNWNELQREYQGLPILTDTIPKINRKTRLEKELKQLEKDIQLLERHENILVYGN